MNFVRKCCIQDKNEWNFFLTVWGKKVSGIVENASQQLVFHLQCILRVITESYGLGFFLNTIHWSSFNNCLQNPECHGLFPVYAKISTHPGGMWIQCVTAKKKKLSNCISRCCDLAHFILNLMNSDIFVQIGHLWQCHKHT